MENNRYQYSFLRGGVFTMLLIPCQLFFWSIYHLIVSGGVLTFAEGSLLVLVAIFFLLLSYGLVHKNKWAYRLSVTILFLMSLTAIVKLINGLSHYSVGYILFLATYLASLFLLITPSVRKQF